MTDHDRRDFLFLAGLGAAALATGCQTGTSTRRTREKPSAGDTIALGIIGVGSLGGGGHHLGRMVDRDGVEVVAVCDVDGEHLAKAVEKTGGRARAYRDHRQLLARDDLDAVIIASPDHWHALHAVDACDAGVDVYCEKPLSLTIADGQAMVAAARRNDTVFQVGTQQRSNERFHLACELVRNGAIGRIERVRCALGRGPVTEPVPAEPIPTSLDWNTWLGPAPWSDYHQNRCHYEFRWFYDYSGGKLTDWGAHHLDIAQWGLGTELSGPIAVEGTGTFPEDNFYETAVDFDVRYEYPGGVEVRATGEGENGVTFTGTDGEIFVSRRKIEASDPAILDYEIGSGEIVLKNSRDHHQDWLDCIRTRQRPVSDVETGHRSASVCHLGNIAIFTGRTLHWDPDGERFRDDDAADAMLRRTYRSPWINPA